MTPRDNTNSMGYSHQAVVIPPSRAKAIQHSQYGCRGRTVAVSYDTHNSNAIVGVACVTCFIPQRCATVIVAGYHHGRVANVLTPLGWRCFECAKAQGFWDEKRDGFAKLICG
jgi:hypothetical protein